MSRRSELLKLDVAARSRIDEQIAFVLGHPGMSLWLKNALRDALTRDPIALINDLEILNLILRNRSEQMAAEKKSMQ